MKTLSQFIEQSHIDASLIRAVVRQCGGWDSFKEIASDVANHGASGGFHGFIFYTDTVAFSSRNKSSILDYAREMARDLGEHGAYSLIAGFNCLQGETSDSVADAINNARDDGRTNVMNALAWFALEEVCRAYTDAIEYA